MTKRLADNYSLKNKKKKQTATLTREEWCEVLLQLGPTDSTSKIYSKLEEQLKIFSETED